MSTVTTQRSGLPLFIIAAFLLAVAIGLVYLLFSPMADGFFPTGRLPRSETSTQRPGNEPDPKSAAPEATPAPSESQPEPEPAAAEPATDPEPSAAEQVPPAGAARDSATQATHLVTRGDTLFDLAATYWSDPYLWPVLYVQNAARVIDPDFLRQGRELDIPSRPADTHTILAAHITAYRQYRDLGNQALAQGRSNGDPWLIQRGRIRINKAHWLLYSGLRYDRAYLDDPESEAAIDAADLRIVRGFIDRYGPAPGVRQN